MPVALKQSSPLCDHSTPIQQEPTRPPVVHSTWVLAVHHWPSPLCFLIIIVEDSCLCLCLSYFHFSVILGIGVNMDSRPTYVVSASYRHSRSSTPSTLDIFRLLSSYWCVEMRWYLTESALYISWLLVVYWPLCSCLHFYKLPVLSFLLPIFLCCLSSLDF